MTLYKRITIPALLIFVIGLIMIFNTSSAEVIDMMQQKNTHSALIKQLLYGVLGVSLAYCGFSVGYRTLIQISPTLLAVLSFLLLLVLIPGIGVKVNGAKRWLQIAGISLQPSEFVKFTCLLYFIYRILKEGIISDVRTFFRIMAVISVPLLLILAEPNNGTVLVIIAAMMGLFFVTKVPLNFWLVPVVGLGLCVAIFAVHMPYVRGRLEVYMHPELDLKGKGHQPFQAKIASGSGGLLGKGPGASMQKLSYLPEAQNDYIGAIYAEEYGFVGMLVLLSLYGTLSYMGFSIAFQAKSSPGFYVAASFTFLFSLQAFLNLGVVSGLLPSTGLNLPFFSQGGSSLLANAFGLGTIMSVNKESMNG